ncbi:hypothetical protein AGLY_012301 [Aphis glycines]|uniref:Uncharacterized protein n=1 Tax=Aphis glycines TaxID=307491 RepID=A0A6G0T9V1_APHGL|nr:hypothetical protein AGLY_012301 [Aphis glycines]
MNGPDIPLFKRFKIFWKNVDTTHFRIYSTFKNSYKYLKDVENEISLFCTQRLNDNFPRDYYREFIELILIFLGGSPPRGIKFRQPGAYHLARWMAKAIYCIKILFFSDQFKITTREQNSLDDLCCFIVKCYIQEWITAPNPITAPMNDLLYLKKLMNYHDKLGEVAIKKFLNHLWYLNEECVVFSKFDDRIDNKTKQHLPCDLLTNKSWKIFERFKIRDDFLRADPKIWKDLEEYKEAKQIISSLKIVNDAAERGVKLMEEFNIKFTKSEDQKQFTLQVVQEYRKRYSGCSREVLKKNYKY